MEADGKVKGRFPLHIDFENESILSFSCSCTADCCSIRKCLPLIRGVADCHVAVMALHISHNDRSDNDATAEDIIAKQHLVSDDFQLEIFWL